MDANSRKSVVLGFYIAGIIIGGGILALPFVARDTGLPLLLILLVLFGILFHLIYVRTLDSIAEISKDVVKFRSGQELFDYALIASNLEKYGKLAFTVGLALYVIPADIVYVLYGMKSLLELSKLLGIVVDEILVFLGLVGIVLIVIGTFGYVEEKKHVVRPEIGFALKLILLLLLWILGIGLVGFVASREVAIILAVSLFGISLLVGAFFPERIFKTHYEEYAVEDIIPRHKVSAVLTMIKISLIIAIPLVAFLIIYSLSGLYSNVPIFPLSFSSVVYSTTIIIFMYVGSGVFNILVYRWIVNNMKIGKKAVLIGTLLSILTYLVFTVLILFSVSQKILLLSDLDREHAFIALSKQLEAIGLNLMGYAVIVIANVFALISVSVAYMGFTDTLSERISIEKRVSFSLIWFLLTIIIMVITSLLEIFDVTRFATDALGLAGNAGGGLFIMVLPWLLKKNNRRRLNMAVIFLVFVTILNIFLAITSATIVARMVAFVATGITLFVGLLAISEAVKAD